MNVRSRYLSTACIPLVLVLGLFLPGVLPAQAPGARTLQNGEGAPLLFLFVPDAVTDDPAVVLERLQMGALNLQELAPRGMWRIPPTDGTIVGYYAGGPSAVAFRLLQRPVRAGTAVITVGAEDTIDSGDGVGTIAPWQLPASAEPVSLDGADRDWEETVPVVRRAALADPVRIEDLASGTPRTVDESRLWQDGGSAVRTVRAQLGRDWWFVAVESSTAIADGLGVHIRAYPRRSVPSPAGEYVVLVAGDSGPVVFRAPGGRVDLVGQYVRRGRFLEFSVSRASLDRIVPDLFDREFSMDLATSYREAGEGERFSLATVFGPEVFAR